MSGAPVVRRTSTRSTNGQAPGVSRTSPRAMSSADSPRRFTATRVAGPRRSCAVSSDCRERTAVSRTPSAVARESTSPSASVPADRVPVTTVPAPLMENARSSHMRTRAAGSGCAAAASISSRVALSSSTPSPVRAETVTSGASDSVVFANSRRTCASVSARRASSARSARVSTMTASVTPKALTASRWSSDCSCQPSSAATTNITAGAGPTPASMLPRNFSCPGTSTNATSRPEGSRVHTNPRSMVRPRTRSSSHRSGSSPVKALTSVDFPWST